MLKKGQKIPVEDLNELVVKLTREYEGLKEIAGNLFHEVYINHTNHSDSDLKHMSETLMVYDTKVEVYEEILQQLKEYTEINRSTKFTMDFVCNEIKEVLLKACDIKANVRWDYKYNHCVIYHDIEVLNPKTLYEFSDTPPSALTMNVKTLVRNIIFLNTSKEERKNLMFVYEGEGGYKYDTLNNDFNFTCRLDEEIEDYG